MTMLDPTSTKSRPRKSHSLPEHVIVMKSNILQSERQQDRRYLMHSTVVYIITLATGTHWDEITRFCIPGPPQPCRTRTVGTEASKTLQLVRRPSPQAWSGHPRLGQQGPSNCGTQTARVSLGLGIRSSSSSSASQPINKQRPAQLHKKVQREQAECYSAMAGNHADGCASRGLI